MNALANPGFPTHTLTLERGRWRGSFRTFASIRETFCFSLSFFDMIFAKLILYLAALHFLLAPVVLSAQVKPLATGDTITWESYVPSQIGSAPITFSLNSVNTYRVLIEENGDRKFLRSERFVHQTNDKFFTTLMWLNMPIESDRRFVRLPEDKPLSAGMDWSVPPWQITTQCGSMTVNYKAKSEAGPDVNIPIDGKDTNLRTIRISYESLMPTCKDGWTFPWRRTHDVLYSPELNELISSKRIDWSAFGNRAFLAAGQNSGDGWAITAVQTAGREKVADAPSQADLVASWLATVEGESRTRTLRIKGVAQKTAETFLLDAEFGFSDTRQTAIVARVEQIAQQRKLILLTQSANTITATQTPNGTFAGTIAFKDGTTKAISIERISEGKLQSKAP